MPTIAAAVLAGIAGLLLAFAGASPAAAQSRPNCQPYCDYTHYYGPYDFNYVRGGIYCYPRCRPDGTCLPNPACVDQRATGRITVRSLAGAATTTPTTATFYDPTVLPPGTPPRRVRRR